MCCFPTKIERLRKALPSEAPPSIEEIDFFADRRYLTALLERDADECFYCGRAVTAETVALDHVIPDADGGDNSHRNIVASCHECNSLKRNVAADEFIRALYRKGILSQIDLTVRLDRLGLLQTGKLLIAVDAPG